MNTKLLFNINKAKLILEVQDILYFVKESKLIKIVLKKHKNYYVNMNIKELQSLLEEKGLYEIYFFRPHYSYIANINYIKLFNSNHIIMLNADKIPISHSRQKEFIKKLETSLH